MKSRARALFAVFVLDLFLKSRTGISSTIFLEFDVVTICSVFVFFLQLFLSSLYQSGKKTE
jgi:hypothetical protein